MKSKLPIALVLILGALAAFLFAQDAKEEKTRIVLIAGQPSHPSGQHEFNAGSVIIARSLNESGLPVQVDVVHNGWPEDESIFDGAAAVVIYSDGNARHPVNGHEEFLDRLTEKGVGVMLMHYAVEVPAGEQGEYFKRWIGGHYEAGFSCNPHWTAPLEPKSGHPISNGVPAFSANDEFYYSMRFADPKMAVGILTSTPTRERINRYIHWTPAGEKNLGKKQSLMWAVEREDGGRGIGFTGGHWHRNWAIDDFRRAVLNAIVWTAKMEVPEGGVESAAVTEAQLNENLDEKKKMEHIALPAQSDLTQPAAEKIDYRWPGMPKG
ncbi:MAG: type 1 glutamine amidotransferase [Verrucomicrobiales bacterium]|jgi:type 1 glutamine amidotransferase